MVKLRQSDKKVLESLAVEKKNGKDEMQATALREKAEISPPVFSEAKKRLLEKGYIQVRDGEQDSRKKIYSLTEEGYRRAVKSIMPNLREKVERQESEIEELREKVSTLEVELNKMKSNVILNELEDQELSPENIIKAAKRIVEEEKEGE